MLFPQTAHSLRAMRKSGLWAVGGRFVDEKAPNSIYLPEIKITVYVLKSKLLNL
jgi:hypothetical protein